MPLSTLSKVELGQTSLSYENLLRICKGLEIDMARLIGAEADGAIGTPVAPAALGRRSVVRAGEGERIGLAYGQGRIAGGEMIRKPFTPVVVDVQAGDVEMQGGFSRDDGEAYVLVLQGEVTLHSELYAPLHLNVGDGAYFDARGGYALVRRGEEDSRALIVFSGDRQS